MISNFKGRSGGLGEAPSLEHRSKQANKEERENENGFLYLSAGAELGTVL